jgi:serine protease Do
MTTDKDTRSGRVTLKNSVLGAVALGAVAITGVLGPWTHESAFAQAGPVTAAPQAAQVIPSFADVIDRVKPAVVSVQVRSKAETAQTSNFSNSLPDIPGFNLPDDHPFQEFFRRFRGDDNNSPRSQRPSPRRSVAQGSGFFISADGYLVTNNHVVENGTEIEILTDDGRTLDAKIVGTDPKTDLALLKVTEGGPFPYAELADGLPRVGDWVLAVGNPFGLGGTVTAGIVSARSRDIGAGPYDDFIQVDAPINRGNSGGPTFNLKGQVVGVNTAIASPSGGNVGIAFAIPSETVKTVVTELKEKGRVERGYLGAQIQPVTKDIAAGVGLDKAAGAIVAGLADDGPASGAGLKTGDVVLSVNGSPVKDARDLSRQIASLEPGSKANLQLWRDGARKDLTVTLGSLPNEPSKVAATGGDSATSLDKLGLTLAPATGDAKGVSIVSVEPGSPADGKGFRKGDVIAEVAGKPVQTPGDVRQALEQSRESGKKAVLFRVEAENRSRFIALQLPAA